MEKRRRKLKKKGKTHFLQFKNQLRTKNRMDTRNLINIQFRSKCVEWQHANDLKFFSSFKFFERKIAKKHLETMEKKKFESIVWKK